MISSGKKEDVVLHVAVIVVMLLTFVRDVIGMGVNQYMLLAIIAFFLVVLKKQQSINFTFFFLPLLCGIQGLSVTAACLVLLVKTKNINLHCLFFAIVLLLFEILNSVFLGPSDGEFTKKLLLYSSNIFLFFYLLYYNNKEFDFIPPIRYFLIGAVFVMVVILFRSISMGGVAGLLNDMTRIGLRSVYEETAEVGTEFQMNPNSLAFYSLFTMAVLLSFNKQLGFGPVSLYLFLSVATLAGILSFSRTWIVCVILYFVFSVILKKNNKREFAIALAAAVLLLIFYGSFFDAVYNVFVDRFSSENLETAGQRTDIFGDYNTWMFTHNRFISGVGMLYYMEITQMEHAIHSGLQQIFVGYGLIGLLLFTIVAMVYKRLFIKNTSWYILLPFFICFVFDQSIQFLSNPILLFPFVMLAYTLRFEKSEL